MKKLLLTALVSTFLATPAVADHWVVIAGYPNMLKLANISNVKRSGDSVKAWVAYVNVDPQKPYDLDLQRIGINCFDESMSINTSYEYFRGKQIKTDDAPSQWFTPPPASLGYIAITTLCDKNKKPEMFKYVFETDQLQYDVPKIQKLIINLKKESQNK